MDTTELPRVEITEWIERANTLNDQHGAVGMADCLTAADLDTLERAAAITSFLAALSAEAQPALAERLTATTAVLLLTAHDLRGADNWPARNRERS